MSNLVNGEQLFVPEMYFQTILMCIRILNVTQYCEFNEHTVKNVLGELYKMSGKMMSSEKT